MPATLAIHVPTEPVGLRMVDDEGSLVIGRADDCDCVIAHDSISRRHARLSQTASGRWLLEDLGSKNGVRVGGRRVDRAELEPRQWLAIGDVFCEFEEIAAGAVDHLKARAVHRRESSQLWIERIDASRGVDALFDTLLRGMVEIAECRRGLLLAIDADGTLRLRACHGLRVADVAGVTFSGSRSAIDRSIIERRAVYLSDRRDHAWLKDKASVIAQGIHAIASLPLLHEGRLLGVAYADTDDEAKVFADLDAELLGAFADRAATALATVEIDAQLTRMESALAGATTASAQASVRPLAWSDVGSASR